MLASLLGADVGALEELLRCLGQRLQFAACSPEQFVHFMDASNSNVQSLAKWGPAHRTQRGGRWHTSEEWNHP
ncbi:UNVERIFIED_CONTAM: hypothetical protein NCL1_53600 [Trichonephila clavipes]